MLDPVLFTILLFGIWTSYTDIKKGMIKNYSVLLLILVAIVLNIFFTKIFIIDPLKSTVNIILAVASGIMLWVGGLWSAADAKLFIAFSFLLPIMFFPILVNSFVPLFFFFFFQILFKTSFREKKEIFIESLKPKSIFSIFLTMLAIMSISYVIFHVFKVSLNYFMTVIIFFTIFWLIEQKFRLKLSYFFIAVMILSLAFFHDIILTTSFFLNWIISSCSILIIFFLIYLSRFVYTQNVKLTELKEGMVPAEMIFKKGRKYFKKPVPFITFLTMLRGKATSKPIFGYNPDGIKTKDINMVVNLYKRGMFGFDEIKICKTIHFAPFIFLGVLLTYFAKGYFISLL